jgi:4-hydroxy-3-polyprenylbenzoate decarboxylase/2,5-furandicarboxylate decarboxylase 1
MMSALTAARVRPKLVIVVDDDINPRDPAQVEWAMAYRVQPDRDVVIVDRLRGVPLDPSSPEPGVGSVMAIDATRPFGTAFPDTTRVPGADEFRVPGLG